MGIYVPEITKPDHCCDCTFCEDSTSDCLLQNDAHWSTYSEQIKNCPIVEISEPHGRLIDADRATAESIKRTGKRLLAIDTAQTVIEAEGRKDGANHDD